MNTLQRYMVLNSLLLVVIPVMSQQKEDKEIKLNEETVKLIQFDFLPGCRKRSIPTHSERLIHPQLLLNRP